MSDFVPGFIVRIRDAMSAQFDDLDQLPSPDAFSGDPDNPEMEGLSDLLQLLDSAGTKLSRLVPRRAASPESLRALEAGARRLWTLRKGDEDLSPDEVALLDHQRRERVGESLTQYWFVRVADTDQVDSLLPDVSALSVVEWAARMPGLSDPQVSHADEFYPDQGYLKAAPEGIGVEAAWDAGYSGAGMMLIDVELGWLFGHDDLPTGDGDEPIYGANDVIRNHGTRVLGIIAGRDGPTRPAPAPPLGIVGIAPHLESLRTSSRKVDNDRYDVAGAVVAAIAANPVPDVILLEVQLDFRMSAADDDPTEVTRRYPMELVPPYWQLIWMATQLGIVVIEPAGNGTSGRIDAVDDDVLGGLDLDGAAGDALLVNFVTAGTKWNPQVISLMELNRQSQNFMDSGAVMVGAAEPNPATVDGETGHHAVQLVSKDMKQRDMWGSNFGSRVDCYAWGLDVVTTDGGGEQPYTRYTTDFGGTSSASAIVAGAALLVQQMFKKDTGGPASPTVVRDFLRDINTSTPHVNHPAPALPRPIGRMPDLKKIVARFGQHPFGPVRPEHPPQLGAVQ